MAAFSKTLVPVKGNADDYRRDMYASWRFWRRHPSTSELVAVGELLKAHPDKWGPRNGERGHLVVWVCDARTKLLAHGKDASSSMTTLRNLYAEVVPHAPAAALLQVAADVDERQRAIVSTRLEAGRETDGDPYE